MVDAVIAAATSADTTNHLEARTWRV
jgi:hypothetical protein